MNHFVRIIEWLGILLLSLIPTVLLSFAAQKAIMLLIYALCTIMILWYFKKLWRQSVNIASISTPAKYPIIASIMALIAMLMVGPIYDELAAFFGIGSGSNNIANQQALAQIVTTAPILAAFHIVVYAPLSEEMVFRGLFLRHFPHPAWLMVLFSAFVFASLHAAPTSWDVMPYFIMGSIFGGLYLYTRQLRYTIAVHIINNLIGYAVLLLQT